MIQYNEDIGEYKFNEKTINRRITRLHCGDTITIVEKDDRKSVLVKYKYKIINVYPYFAIGVCRNMKKCFCIGDLVVMGIEPEKIYV